MAFSRITITFNEDLVDGDNIAYTTSNPILVLGATWVVSRSNSFEVTQATPTGNAGEATAIAYKQTFEWDYDLSNYIITQTLNEVQITIRNESQTFIEGLSNKDVDFVVDSVPSIPIEQTDRINVRSPYHLYAPIFDGVSQVDPTNVVYNIYIWSGDIATDKPVEPNYVYEKKSRYLGDKVIYIEISKQVQDFIKNNYTGVLNATSVFVSWDITTTYSGGSLVSSNTVLAFDGYNNHFDGVNYLPSKDLMINNKYIYVTLDGVLSIPIYQGGEDYNIEFRNNTAIEDDATVTAINIQNTNDAVVYLTANAENVNNIRIENTTQATEEILDVKTIDECIYNPIKCVFLNKEGVLQDFWFFKANKEELKVTDETYKANVLTESIVDNKAVLSYSSSNHLNIRYNTQGNKDITLNTGYISEDNNTLIEEILMSEYIWLNINGVISPVDIKDKSVPYLTKRNDQLIKYTLKFTFSYDVRQNIR